MRTRLLGTTGLKISVVGYGAMALSLRDRPPKNEAVQILKRVLEADVTLIDTADTYCLGRHDLHHNERLVAAVVANTSLDVCIATKGGTLRTEHGWQVDGSPDRLYRSIVDSYEALGGRSAIPLWQLHWPDPRYTIAEM